MTIKEAQQIDMVDYLHSKGINPQKISGNNYWYLSPFRKEKTPSFKVNRTINKWYDFGQGKGGDLLSFLSFWKEFPFGQAIAELTGHKHLQITHKVQQPHTGIKVISVAEITSPELVRYYRERRIDDGIAKKYLKEVKYQNSSRQYHALGFENDRGGYELRTRYFKGSSTPKSPTHINNNSHELAVFEGFFDFLSYLTINNNQHQPSRDFLVLNSASFFLANLTKMQTYNYVFLYLDNDSTGTKYTHYALDRFHAKFRDARALYAKYKDYNDWHINFGKARERPG